MWFFLLSFYRGASKGACATPCVYLVILASSRPPEGGEHVSGDAARRGGFLAILLLPHKCHLSFGLLQVLCLLSEAHFWISIFPFYLRNWKVYKPSDELVSPSYASCLRCPRGPWVATTEAVVKRRAFEAAERIRKNHHDVVLSRGSPGVSRTDAEEEARRRPQSLQGCRQEQGNVLREFYMCVWESVCPRSLTAPATYLSNRNVSIVCFSLLSNAV